MESDLPRTEVSGRELDLIEKLLLLDAVLNKDGENLHKRLLTIPIGKGDPCMVVHTDAMRELINLVCNAECAMCAKFSAPEIKGCKLRKTLMDIASLNDSPPPGRCGYRDILFDD